MGRGGKEITQPYHFPFSQIISGGRYMYNDTLKELERIINIKYTNISGIIVQKNSINLYEKYFNGYTADNAVHIYSVTKSLFSALIGIAVDKGFIKSVDQKVLDFFPDYSILDGEKTIQTVTIKNLLTMTAPYKYESEPYEEFFASADWMKTALDLLGGEKNAGTFMYSPIIGAHILAGVLVNATGQSVLDFAMKNLFLPMQINVSRNIELRSKEEHIAVMNNKNTTGWAVDPQGINTASWGLFLTPRDMMKVGQLYLNNGIWNGKQLISSRWIEESTTQKSWWNELSYGYLWWIIDSTEGTFAALGQGGNVIYVNRTKKIVVCIASLLTQNEPDMIDFIKNQIEPLV